MGIGVGVVLLVLGLIFTFALQVDIPGLGDQALGWILIIGGIVSIVLGLVMNKQRTREPARRGASLRGAALTPTSVRH